MASVSVTHLWMSGVVGMMMVFGSFAIFGYLRHNSSEADNKDDQD